jgi:hypothetical protein
MCKNPKDPNEEIKRIAKAFGELDKQTPGDSGVDYKPLYYHLFNGITDTVNSLQQLQAGTEEMFVRQGEDI